MENVATTSQTPTRDLIRLVEGSAYSPGSKSRSILIGKLSASPANPRLGLHEHVISALVAKFTEAQGSSLDPFADVPPLDVRELPDGDFEVINGHHRLEAARRARLLHVPCLVHGELDDEEAAILSVARNNQHGFSKLEIGRAALRIPGEEGGRGKRGGLSRFAEAIGRKLNYVSEARLAAEVYEAAAETLGAHQGFPEGLRSKASHLKACHSANEQDWPDLVHAMLKGDWTEAETKKWVKRVKEHGLQALQWSEERFGQQQHISNDEEPAYQADQPAPVPLSASTLRQAPRPTPGLSEAQSIVPPPDLDLRVLAGDEVHAATSTASAEAPPVPGDAPEPQGIELALLKGERFVETVESAARLDPEFASAHSAQTAADRQRWADLLRRLKATLPHLEPLGEELTAEEEKHAHLAADGNMDLPTTLRFLGLQGEQEKSTSA